MKKALALIALGLIGAAFWAAHPKGADSLLVGPELPPVALPEAATQNGIRLLAAGTSLTVLTEWPEALATQLQSCLSLPVHLQRVAQPGQTSDWGRANISQGLSPAPDIALIEFTINDADIRRGVSTADSLNNHLALIKALRDANPDVQIVLLRLNRAYGLRAMIRPHLATYDRALAQIATQERVHLMDLRPLWAEAGRDVLPDGIHPTSEAALAINAPALTRGLAKIYGPSC